MNAPRLCLALFALGFPTLAGVAEAEQIALIDHVVVDGERLEEPTVDQASVLRDSAETPEPVQPGMGLNAGDEIRTGPGSQVVLGYLDDDREVDLLVFIYHDASYKLVSPTVVEGFFGRLFASVSGLFTVITSLGTLGVEGTEFEVDLEPGLEGTLDVRVLEGVVAYRPATDQSPAESAESHVTAADRLALERRAIADGVHDVGVLEDRARRGEVRDSDVLGSRVRTDVIDDLRAAGRRALRIRPLERLSLGPGASAEATVAMEASEVKEVLKSNDDVFLAIQPSYSAAGDAPHFRTVEDRSRAFRAARYEAIWNRDPQARAELGHVYKDWGEDRRASRSYAQAAAAEPALNEAAEFVASWAEANRRIGLLETAREQADRAIQLDPTSGRASLVLGNVYREVALEAAAADDTESEAIYLERALEAYEAADESDQPSAGDSGIRDVAATNRAEVHVSLAQRAITRGDSEAAEQELVRAEEVVSAAPGSLSGSEYPFLLLVGGQIRQETARLASASGDGERANAMLELAVMSYSAAIEQHEDLAPAYYRLGTVYEERGETELAEREYEKSVKTRPTYSPTYDRLGQLKEKQLPGSGARHLDTYRRITSPDGALVPRIAVPDLLCKLSREAAEALSEAGLHVDVVGRGPQVVRQDTAPGTLVAKGAHVTLHLGRCTE